MPEIKSEVKTYSVNYVCDKCGNGFMERFGDMVFTSNPPQYSHKCSKCGDIQYFYTAYPYQKLEYY